MAVAGAKMSLILEEMKAEAELILKKVRYPELTNNPDFNWDFVNALFLPLKI